MRFRCAVVRIPFAIMHFVCLTILCAAVAQAQPSKTGLMGLVADPSGRSVSGAIVLLEDVVTGTHVQTQSGVDGRYSFELAPGKYRMKVTFSGFEPWTEEVTVEAGHSQNMDVKLAIPPRRESVNVAGEASELPLAADQEAVSDADRIQRHNSAQLLTDLAGVSLRHNGELASMPLLHGLGDERTKVVVNGVTISNACANHMNPSMSYIEPWNVSQVQVIAGITPVSMGGDSVGGTVSVDSPPPVFANGDRGWRYGGVISSFYRSNGENYGPALSAWAANDKFSVGYAGSFLNADDYTDGGGHKVTSTYAQSTDNTVTVAARLSGNLFTFQAGLHHIPYQGFTNAQMDMVRNYAESMNLRYQRAFKWGFLDARVYWQGTWHSMNIGKDKSTFPMPMWMPMNTHGRDAGYSVAAGLPISERHNLRIGSELHRFVLDDDWPPVPGTEPYMGPDTFVNVNDGRRSRLARFGELNSKWSAKWSTLLGIRNDTVWMNTGQVSGYSDMYAVDADAFNAASHARTDVNLDVTALARYQPNESMTVEFGYAVKREAQISTSDMPGPPTGWPAG